MLLSMMMKLLLKPRKRGQKNSKRTKGKRIIWRAYGDNQENLPIKEVNPGIVVLYVYIGNMKIVNALVELGASVNIMPLLIVEMIEYL